MCVATSNVPKEEQPHQVPLIIAVTEFPKTKMTVLLLSILNSLSFLVFL